MLPELKWKKLSDIAACRLAALLVDPESLTLLDQPKFDGSYTALTFYKQHKLIRLQCVDILDREKAPEIYALWKDDASPLLLDGTSAPVHCANESEKLQLTQETVPDYIRFFCFAVRGDAGPFILLEEPPAQNVPEQEEVAKLAKPLTQKGLDETGHYLYDAVVVYEGGVFGAVFAAAPDGQMQMVDDTPLFGKVPTETLPVFPDLRRGAMLLADLARVKAGSNLGGAPSDKPALTTLVELLLEKALRDQSHNRLIEHFNASRASASPIDQFAALMVTTSPIVVVESSLPFVEETIAEIVCSSLKVDGKPRVCKPAVGLDDNQISFTLPSNGPALVLVPLQFYNRVAQLDRLAYELASRNLTAIIACEQFNLLPDSLRRLKDVTLKLPPINEALFEALFERVMGSPLPLGWQGAQNQWVKHVLHTDFEHPRRMNLSLDQAFEYIRAQVTERLTAVDPIEGLSLNQLYGLGEARQFAEDLIADIHAAIKGQIPWSQVDHGALLVGPPGTGKTTLARAIAKDCGVKFIMASATGWQAAGEHIGHHIGAIRKSFSEARTYAPSILFIDEIDSLGSREQFSGRNAQYLTEVINAVLEQVQGLDSATPVIVIGATNYEDHVDPALRRSGRLDRTIQIPRPNSESLDKIYGHYVAEAAMYIDVDSCIDTKALGGLSVGLTGADVERIIRGAARRARKDRRKLSQTDIIAEMTNKPRGSDGPLRMLPAEIERIAYHEAGHTLAEFLGASRGTSLGFVTIVPRDNGTLGFTASVPDERIGLTRKDYDEKLEICLAGRAAEDLKYGHEYVSGGASSDLKVATSLATNMITKLGLGGPHKLLWSESPMPADLELAEKMLGQAYDRVLQRLKDNEPRLRSLVHALIARQELTGDEVRKILSA